jgi:hypothetical protein
MCELFFRGFVPIKVGMDAQRLVVQQVDTTVK